MPAWVIGTSIGCLLGLCPLLLMEDEQTKARRLPAPSAGPR